MTQDWDRSFVASALGKQGYVVMPGFLPDPDRRILEDFVQSVRADDWQAGDTSPHTWSEYHLRNHELDHALNCCPSIEASLPRRLSGRVGWCNRFRRGQWIESHIDAAGDLQLLVCIQVPEVSDGGQFWLGEPEHVLPIGTGDALFFEASKVSHGTTMPRTDTAERKTLNVRMWFDIVLR